MHERACAYTCVHLDADGFGYEPYYVFQQRLLSDINRSTTSVSRCSTTRFFATGVSFSWAGKPLTAAIFSFRRPYSWQSGIGTTARRQFEQQLKSRFRMLNGLRVPCMSAETFRRCGTTTTVSCHERTERTWGTSTGLSVSFGRHVCP